MILRGALPWLLVFALVGSQWLGLVHRVAHGAQAPATVAGAHAHDGEHAWADGLFGGHDGDATCRLFDSVCHGGAPVVPSIALPVLLAGVFLDVFSGEFIARWAALFDARGPPVPR